MVTKRLYSQYDEQPPSPKEVLPTMYDLPDEDEDQPGMPDIFHVWQARLLDETFRPPNYEPEEIFTASDLNIYYNVHDFSQCKRPDWFAVIGLPKLEKKPEMRLSYLIWQEGIAPLIVVELLSPSITLPRPCGYSAQAALMQTFALHRGSSTGCVINGKSRLSRSRSSINEA